MLPPPQTEELSRVIYDAVKRHPRDTGAIVHRVHPLLERIWQDWFDAVTELDKVIDERDAWKVRAEVAEKLLNAQPRAFTLLETP